MKRILSVALATLFAVAMPAVQAQSIPSMEACVKYAEADAAYNTVDIEARTVRVAAEREPIVSLGEAYAAHLAAMKEAGAAYDDAAHVAAKKEAFAAYEAAKQEAEAVYEAAMNEAHTVRTQTYLAIYAEGGGMQSDVWEVMMKLLAHQRELCTEHYGL